MSDYLPTWTALGAGVAEGEKQPNKKNRETAARENAAHEAQDDGAAEHGSAERDEND